MDGRGSAPDAAIAGQHLVGCARAPFAGAVAMWLASRPELLERVDDPPGQLDLLVVGEQRLVAEQHVEQQPLVGLGRGLGEGFAVQEVHGHVADLHRATPAPSGAEAQRDALVGLDAYDELVVAELGGVGVGEGQVRRLAEDDGDLGDATGQPLAGAQVERHAAPAPRLDAEADGGVRLGRRVGGTSFSSR